MRRPITYTLTPLLALLLAIGGLLLRPEPSSADGPVLIGGDPNVTGNTATSLSTTEGCVSVNEGDTFDFDLFVSDVEDLVAWEMYVKFDPPIVHVVNADLWQFLGNNLYYVSEPLSGGRYFLGATDAQGTPKSGSGVLARLTLEATAPGQSAATIYTFDVNGDGVMDFGPRLTAAGGVAIGDTTGDGVFDGATHSAVIAVGESCAAGSDGGSSAPPSEGPAGGGQDGSGSDGSLLDRLTRFLNEVAVLAEAAPAEAGGSGGGATGAGATEAAGAGGAAGPSDSAAAGESQQPGETDANAPSQEPDGSDDASGPATSGDDTGPTGGAGEAVSPSDGGGFPLWAIGAIAAGALVVAAGASVVLAARAGGRFGR